MARTVENLLQSISRNVNGIKETPTGQDYTDWLDMLNEANREWNETFDFQSMVKTYTATALQSGTSIALPSDFRGKIAGYVDIGGTKYGELGPVERTRTTGVFIEWGGNQSDGFYLKIAPALASTLIASVQYHSKVADLTTLTDASKCPIDDFLVNRVSEMILMNREQPQDVDFRAKADILLQRMVDNELSQNFQKDNSIKDYAQTRGFVLGED